MGWLMWKGLYTIFFADYQLQARPFFIHRADLYIDQPERKCGLADGVFGDLGRQFRGLFVPRNPDRAVLLDESSALIEFAEKVVPAVCEKVNHIHIRAELRRQVHIRRQRLKKL